jgi:hypothetical protein
MSHGVDLVFGACFSESSIHRFAVSSPVGLETILQSSASETSFFEILHQASHYTMTSKRAEEVYMAKTHVKNTMSIISLFFHPIIPFHIPIST